MSNEMRRAQADAPRATEQSASDAISAAGMGYGFEPSRGHDCELRSLAYGPLEGRDRLRKRGPRAAAAILTVVTLFLSATPTIAATAPSAAAQTTLTVPDLNEPAVRVLDMTCGSGQTDLNHASTEALATALGLDEVEHEALLGRVKAGRPYNGLDDLLAIAGFGAGRLRKINPEGVCVTPIVDGAVPPIDTEVCLPGDGRVDINAATESNIAAVLPSSRTEDPWPTAARIVERRDRLPFPDLNHLVAVEGIGPGTLSRIRSRLCRTPAPYTAVTADGYRQRAGVVYAGGSGVAIRFETPLGLFALGVPSGVLHQGAAWATITDIPESDALLPAADFHIHGVWGGDGKLVYVSVPSRSSENPAVLNSVAHVTGSGPEGVAFASPSNLLDRDGTLTTSASSLSIWQSAFAPLRIISAPTADVSTNQALLKFIAEWRNYRAPDPICPARNGNWPYELTVAGTALANQGVKHCTTIDSQGRAVLRMAQNRFFVAKGNIDHDTGDGARFGTYGSPGSGAVGAAMQGLSGVFATDGRFSGLAPGGTIDLLLDPTDSSVEAQIEAAPILTATYILADEIVKLGGIAPALAQAVTDCVYEKVADVFNLNRTVTSSDQRQLAHCIASVIVTSVEVAFKIVSAALLKVDGGMSLIDMVREQFNDIMGKLGHYPQVLGDYKVIRSPKPRTDRLGRFVLDHCLAASQFSPARGLGWTIDDACQNAYYQSGTTPPPGSGASGTEPWAPGLILRDGHETWWYSYGQEGRKPQLSPITSGNLYLCLARYYAVDWADDEVPSQYAGADIFLNPVNCDNSAPPAILNRTTVPADTYILRESSGRSWRIFSDGRRSEIPSGREFMCLTDPDPNSGIAQFFVWDQVPVSVIEASWPDVVPYTTSNCPGF